MNSLKDLVNLCSPCIPYLPFTHTTTVSDLEEILRTKALVPKQCDVFKTPLIYLFYGRADFSPNLLGNNYAMPHAKPVTILINHSALPSNFESSPFDTGAFFSGLFRKVLGEFKDDELSDKFNKNYALYDDFNTPSKFVSYMYGSNKNFIESTPKDSSQFSNCLAAIACHQLASSLASEAFDSRCSSIESRVSNPIAVNKANIELVIYPSELENNFKPVLNGLGINCDSYPKGGICSTDKYMGKISMVLDGYYKKMGIL